MSSLSVRELSRRYEPEVFAVDGVSFVVPDGRVAALLGPSGCGKTTVLRLIAGLDRPDAGDVLLDDASILHRPPHRRGVGLLFQELALFPHLDVRANVEFGPRMAKWPRARRERRAAELLELVGLGSLANRRVDALSGGERQRVGLARALAPEPEVLLLDEPLGALDEARKQELRRELRGLLDRLSTTALIVSHDVRDAQALADDLIVMDAGRVLQSAPLRDVLSQPATAYVAAMVGWVLLACGPLLDGRVAEDGVGAIEVPPTAESVPPDVERVRIMAHPSTLLGVPPGSGLGSGAHGIVTARRPDGPLHVIEVALEPVAGPGDPATRYVEVRWEWGAEAPAPGAAIEIAVRPETLRFYSS